MTRDDELRSRISDLAEGAEISEISVDQVQARGRRRNLNQRMLALAAAFLFVVGVAGVVQTLRDDEGTLGVAVDVGADTPSGSDSQADAASAAPAIPSPTPSRAAGADAALSYYDSESRGGPSSVLPWGDGFVSFSQVWHEPTDAMADLVPDLADRFPTEIADALEEAGVESTNIEESMAALDEAGLLDLATEIVQSDPELLDAYMAATSGTYTLEAQISDDGVTWTALPGFSAPGELGYSASDGVHLVLANQDWTQDGGAVDVEVSITTDLTTWTTVTIPVERPAAIPEFVTFNSNLSALALGPDGWYVTTEANSWFDVWSAFPDDLQAEMELNGWGYTAVPEGIRLESHGRRSAGEGDEGFDYPVIPAVSSSYPVVPPQPIPVELWESTLERLIPWTDLGLVYDDYAPYLSGSSQTAGWVGTWAGGVARASAPASANCCTVVGTGAGYLAMAWDAYEYTELEEGPSNSVFFSPDGHSWNAVDAPGTEGFIDAIVAVRGGVLLTVSDEAGQQIWRGDADGTNWQPVTVPGISDTWLWFAGGGDGVVSVVDVATYEYVGPPPVEYEASIEYDGHEIYTHQFEDGTALTRVTNQETGEVVLESAREDFNGDIPSFLELLDNGGIGFVDADGVLILEVPLEMLSGATASAEQAARSDQDWEEPSYEPDFHLIASVDGISWHVEDLPDTRGGYYESPPAINGTTVVLQMAGEWQSFDIS